LRVTDYTGELSVLEIHLDRIARNYLLLQKKLIRGADCAAVVKADCYGLGVRDVVPELYKANCRHFYVAYASEGLAVRETLKGQEAQVYAFHGADGIPTAALLENNIIPVLNSLGDIEQWSAFARQTGRKLPAVIHLDTGMNRLGLSATEVAQLKNTLDVLKPLDVRYIMSHLACSDEPDHPKNQEQLATFKKFTAQLGLPCRLSFANSGGIFLGDEYHFDQARPGCSIYGVMPHAGLENPMLGVITLKGRILQTREIAAGETVGYGACYKASSPVKLATISVGYADGILRCLGEKGMVVIGGQKCPIAGRVSMDTIIVDVTAVKTPVKAGDWAEMLGPHQTVDDLAVQAGTNGDEILTSLGKRYKRVYTTQETL
jgi:alanine racemase